MISEHTENKPNAHGRRPGLNIIAMDRLAAELAFAEKRDWLRLINSERVGPIIFHRLLDRFGSVGDAIDALPELSRRGGGRKISPLSAGDAEALLEAYEAIGARVIALGEPDYPPLLAHVEDAPPLISVLGDASHLGRPTMAIVGTRNASVNGRRLAKGIAAALGAEGFVVASGLARGIDAAAHHGSLKTGTIAMVAGGVDVIYPKENTELYGSICKDGAVMSEMPPGMVPQARHFPRRNRLISGCAQGVVVVEATRRSGSLITARMALEQNREVFAIPGSPMDPRAGGTNDLIRQGAVLTETVEDILEVVGGLNIVPRSRPEPVANQKENRLPADESELGTARMELIKCLGPAPVTVDELIRECHMSPAVVSTILLELKLAAKLERHPGNQVSLIGNV